MRSVIQFDVRQAAVTVADSIADLNLPEEPPN